MDVSEPPVIIGFSLDEQGEIESDEAYSFARCPVCGRAGIAGAGRVRELGCRCLDQLERAMTDLKEKALPRLYARDGDREDVDSDFVFWCRLLDRVRRGDDSPSIRLAYIAAQQARFDHGESGGRH